MVGEQRYAAAMANALFLRIYRNLLTRVVSVATDTGMEITFDPAKNEANIAKHGLSFADFAGFDADPAIVVDDRYDYGETRYVAFGRVNGEGRSLVFTIRDDGLRAISLRRARDKEMRRYE
jgi:uncharacterized DUF497 family protein